MEEISLCKSISKVSLKFQSVLLTLKRTDQIELENAFVAIGALDAGVKSSFNTIRFFMATLRATQTQKQQLQQLIMQ